MIDTTKLFNSTPIDKASSFFRGPRGQKNSNMTFSSYVVVDVNTSAPNFEAVTRCNYHYYLEYHDTDKAEPQLVPLCKVSPRFCPEKFSSFNVDLEVRPVNPRIKVEKILGLNYGPYGGDTLGILADPRFLFACNMSDFASLASED
jgi:hypothetical protein